MFYIGSAARVVCQETLGRVGPARLTGNPRAPFRTGKRAWALIGQTISRKRLFKLSNSGLRTVVVMRRAGLFWSALRAIYTHHDTTMAICAHMRTLSGAGAAGGMPKSFTTYLTGSFLSQAAIFGTTGFPVSWTGRVSKMCDAPLTLQQFSHVARKVGPQVQRRINALKVGQKMQDLPEELWHDSFRYYVKEDPNRVGGPNLRIIRLDPRKPSLTVTGFIFNKFVHPVENRYITPREAARLQGFPDDFLFCGTLTSVQRQVGNAVPVQMAQAVARQILEHVEHYQPFGLGNEIYRNLCLPAVSLFSGAGGMDIGFLHATRGKARFDVKACVELDHDCCETLRRNFGSKVGVYEHDISTLDCHEVLSKCQIEGSALPLVFGGPPCQAFSQAGKQKGVGDPRGELIQMFLRFVQATKPVYFVMENVSNLRGISRGSLLAEVQSEMDRIGYNVTCNLLCAADYGAPQLRRRLVFIGVRKPFPAVSAPLPTHGDVAENLFVEHPYVGVGAAFEGLPILRKGDYDSACKDDSPTSHRETRTWPNKSGKAGNEDRLIVPQLSPWH